MQRTPGTGAYRSVWRWHFYAGLFSAPLLIVLTLTGAIYLFDREIDGWWNRDMQAVAVGGAALPLAAQEAAVLRAAPSSAGSASPTTQARPPSGTSGFRAARHGTCISIRIAAS